MSRQLTLIADLQRAIAQGLNDVAQGRTQELHVDAFLNARRRTGSPPLPGGSRRDLQDIQ
jgi:hypothetical protein